MRLAERYSLNEKTVRKWRKRTSVEDARMGPKEVRSSVLSPEEEAMCLAFRRHTLLPLDDCLYALQASIPHLRRSALHRLFQRHDISRLPDMEGDKPKRSKFKRYPIGYQHIYIAELRTEEGKLRMFVAIDRTSKFAFAKLVPKAGKMAAAAFLREVVEALPYKVNTVLTDAFGIACAEHGIEHRLTKVNHPWTNGQVERMNRTIKEATVKRYHYGSHDQLRTHLADFVAAYNFAKHLKTLRGLTPYEYVVKCWTEKPDRFKVDPCHHISGPNT
nr:IS481 family transposase [Jannaschia rubra]